MTAAFGGTTVTLPGAGYFGASAEVALAPTSEGLALPQGTLTLASALAYPPIAGDIMVPVLGGTWTKVTYSSISGTVLSGCLNGSGTTTTGDVYLLPPEGEEFSIAQLNNSGAVTLQAPPGSLVNGGSSFTLAPQRTYRVILCWGNWNVLLGLLGLLGRPAGHRLVGCRTVWHLPLCLADGSVRHPSWQVAGV